MGLLDWSPPNKNNNNNNNNNIYIYIYIYIYILDKGCILIKIVQINKVLKSHMIYKKESMMAYKKVIYSQKSNFCKQKLNACGSNSHNIFKIVNIIFGSNLNTISNRLSNYNMCSYFVSSLYNKLSIIYKYIKSRLALIPPSIIAYQINEPTLCNLSSFSSPSIFEFHKLIMISNSTSHIDPLPLVVFKNAVFFLSNIISNLISESLNDGIMAKSLKYAIIKPILKQSYLDTDDLMNNKPKSQLPIISKIMNV